MGSSVQGSMSFSSLHVSTHPLAEASCPLEGSSLLDHCHRDYWSDALAALEVCPPHWTLLLGVVSLGVVKSECSATLSAQLWLQNNSVAEMWTKERGTQLV